MTMLASWIGIDTHGPTSAYIISDSRFSWTGIPNFDYGKKVFASKKYPELFGYAGDVFFPSIVLSQIIEMIDAEVLLNKEMDCNVKHKLIAEKICYSFSKYPDALKKYPIQIIHITRETTFERYPKFKHFILTYENNGWTDKEVDIPQKSGILHVLGSGKKEFRENYEKFENTENASTSRNVYQCFVYTLKNIKDAKCGGAPQLVGLYRKPLSVGINYGIIYGGKRYLLGMEIPRESAFENVDWRNELFEICDGNTKQIVSTAVKQPLPRNID